MKPWKFAATFAPGTGGFIVRQLKQRSTTELALRHQEDGLCTGETTLSPETLSGMRFWHNAFLVVAEAENVQTLDLLFPYLTTRILRPALKHLPSSAHTIRLRVVDENQPTSWPAHHQRSAEKVLDSLGLVQSSHHPDVELWVVRRQSGFGFVGLLLPKPRFKRRKRAAGELRPEVAHILGLAAGIGSKDVVLDPFAGYGAIPREMIAGFSPRQVLAIEQDPRLLGSLQALAKEKPSLKVMAGDALHMSTIANSSVTRIVTDPPWGEYAPVGGTPENFCRQMLVEFARVLVRGGVTVLLYPDTETMRTAIAQQTDLELIKTTPVLISGKKATIYKLRRR